VAEVGSRPHSWNERSVCLGPGLIRLPDGTYRRPEEVSFQVRCVGPLAHWVADLTVDLSAFPDGSERPYLLYPLPPQASISKLVASQGGTEIGPSAQVRPLDQLPEGAATPSDSLMETFGQESLPLLSVALDGYLKACQPDQKVQFQLIFGNGLPTVDGRINLRFPGKVDEGLAVHGQTRFKIQVEIEDGNELVDDPICSEPFEQRMEGEILHLEGSGDLLERDVEVTFRPGRTEMPVTRLRRSSDNFLFSIFPPTSIPASPQRRDLVFCVDASENVEAGLFELIRDDLCATLRRLDDNDRFALVTYGRDIDGYEGGEFCEVAQVEEACRWLHTVEPKGRADIQPLLARIQALPSQPDRQLCIFLLAAGHVGNEPAILKSLDFDQSDRRYYAVGIGPTVEQAFLRRLALLARGRCEVAPQGHCAEALARLLSQTRALLAEVTFEGQDGSSPEIDMETLVPSRMGSLTPEGPVHCLGQGSPSSLRFRSKDETGVFFAGTVNARNTENPAMSGVWAGLRVGELLDSVRLSTGTKRKQLRAETAALASAHGILVEDTVLVLESSGGDLDVQLSALPYRWSKGGQPVAKADEEATTAPAFDWRKGLKARDGLFKGARPGEADSGEMRHGLRRPGELAGRAARAGRDQGKPMLDRMAISAAAVSALDDEELEGEEELEVAEESLEREGSSEKEGSSEEQLVAPQPAPESAPAPLAEPEPVGQEPQLVSDASLIEEIQESAPPRAALDSPDTSSPQTEELDQQPPPSQPSVASSTEGAEEPSATRENASVAPPPAPVTAVVAPGLSVPAGSEPTFQYVRDPLAESRARMDSYLEQVGSIETRMAMASLAALPTEVARAGPDLPRILAQTVGHLEKRGYYSAALSVMGLLLKEYSSPEVLKKMESLLIAWAHSLEDQYLPEALHILRTGLRVCPGSESLVKAMDPLWARWNELSGQQRDMPEVADWRASVPEAQADPLLSPGQLEMARLQKNQQALAGAVESLRVSVEQQLAALPQLLDSVLASRPVVVQAAPQTVPQSPPPASAAPEPEPAAQSAPAEGALTIELPLPEELPPAEPTTPPPTATATEGPLGQPEEPPLGLELPLPELPLPEPVASVEEAAPVPELPLPEAASAGSQTVASAPEPVASGPEPEPEPEVASAPEPVVAEPEPEPVVAELEPEVAESAEDSGESLNLTRDELLELLQAEPRDESGHRAVKTSMPDPKDRINFFRDLVRLDKDQIYHSLALARAYREADQTKVAVVHYQKYLRSEKDPVAQLELADAYDELGKTNLSVAARKAAEQMM
jgi:hypothetical protein